MEIETFTYTHPITVRYGDLDPQGHVNNAAYLSYLESARLGYYEHAGIWQPGTLTGMVVGRIEIDYLASIIYGQGVQVGIRLAELGNKSLTFAFQIETAPERTPLARGRSIIVAYDNAADASRPVPPDWREKLSQFEGWTTNNETA
ncbi:acyl-CoA thioesterase [bacterium]|nr:acyl-CoA thioesterase [bacterium]